MNQKVLPSPGVLSAPTSPPIRSRQSPGDGEAEAGAAVFARGRGIGLLEGLEQRGASLSGAMPMPVSSTSKRTSNLVAVFFQQLGAQGDGAAAR